MHIVAAIRSEAAYELVKTKLALSQKLSDVRLTENVTSLEMLNDFIHYFEAEIYLIDRAILNAQEMADLLERENKKYLVLEGLNQVDLDVAEALELQEEEEVTETIQMPKNEPTEKKEVVIKEIEKEVFVEKYRAIPPVTILIGSLYSSAGSSTIATNLACMIAARGIDVTYIEIPIAEPRMYDTLQVEFAEDQVYENFAQKIVNGHVPNEKTFYSKGVHWVVNNPNDQIEKFSYEQYNVLLSCAKTTVTIIDVSNHLEDPEILKLMNITDANYIVLEANPVKNQYHMLKNNNLFSKLGESNITFQLILTKTGIKGIEIKGIRDSMPKRPYIELPYIPYEILIRNLFELKFYYETEEGENYFEKNFKKVVAFHLPKNFTEKRKGKRFFSWLSRV